MNASKQEIRIWSEIYSTSKVSFPGSGIAALAASEANLEDAEKIHACADYTVTIN